MRIVRVIYMLVFSLLALPAITQTTKIRGTVTNADTGESLPYASVTVEGTTIGTTTDLEGVYNLETREPITELTAFYVSFEDRKAEIKPHSFNTVDFALKPIENLLDVVVVTPGINPADTIMQNVIRNKKRNNPAEIDSYMYTIYTKMELDLTNMKPEFKNKRMQRNFAFVFDYIDTSALTGKAYLPAMITEATADYYYRRNPRLSREVLKASRISGFEENVNTFSQFTGQMYVHVNLYDNFINIFEVNFASPLNDNGQTYYKYFLIDSVEHNGRLTYTLRFHPKSVTTPVFDGEMDIDAQTWGLVSASIKMQSGVNVNWIRHLAIDNTLQLVGDSTWFMKQDKIVADFALDDRSASMLTSFMAHRQVDYSDIRINEEIPPDIARLNNNVILAQEDIHSEDRFWDSIRPYDLSLRERRVFEMVDSIKNVQMFKNFTGLLNTALFGYLKVGKIEFGPYYKIYSHNQLEGSRIQLGVRTNKDFSQKLRLSGYAAYGFKDDALKGGGQVEYMFSSMPTSVLSVSARHDAVQLGSSKDPFNTGNIMGAVFARGSNNKLTIANQYSIKFEKEWMSGLSNTFQFAYDQIFPNVRVPFVRPDGTPVHDLRGAIFKVNTRISKDEVVIRRTFDKQYMNSPYPVIDIELSGGLKDFLGNHYSFFRAEATLDYDFNVGALGRSNLILAGGKIFGKVPFPLLKLHEGNATYLYDRWAFSGMNFYEFASDTWAQIFFEHHFRGLIFNRLPLIKKTKLREVFTVKALWGSLSDRNNGSLQNTGAPLLFPHGMGGLSTPYVEIGAGVENIFRLFRIDGVWRLTHRQSQIENKVSNFSVNFSFNLTF